MTDNEIIKALECCTVGTFDCSKECPCYSSKSNLKVSSCRFELMCEISDLINRQKADLESLKQIIDEQDKEIFKLQKRIIFWREDLNYQPEKIKSEAIKEFAHFVIDKSRNGVIYASDIPDLVKELTEVEINQRKEDDGK